MVSRREEKKEIFERMQSDIRKMGDMSIRDCVLTFGYFENLESLVKSIKLMEDIHEKRIKNAVAAGELVSRDLIHKGVIDQIEIAHNRMLTDGAKTMAKRLHDKYKSGADVAAGQKLIRDELSKIIGPSKRKIDKVLKGLL